jgi:hypothetical protein
MHHASVRLEELDKFRPTVNRLRNLYCLIDAVYEADGIIVSTANETLDGLKELLGEPVFRRLSGSNDEDGSYLVWDLHKAPKVGPAERIRNATAG